MVFLANNSRRKSLEQKATNVKSPPVINALRKPLQSGAASVGRGTSVTRNGSTGKPGAVTTGPANNGRPTTIKTSIGENPSRLPVVNKVVLNPSNGPKSEYFSLAKKPPAVDKNANPTPTVHDSSSALVLNEVLCDTKLQPEAAEPCEKSTIQIPSSQQPPSVHSDSQQVTPSVTTSSTVEVTVMQKELQKDSGHETKASLEEEDSTLQLSSKGSGAKVVRVDELGVSYFEDGHFAYQMPGLQNVDGEKQIPGDENCPSVHFSNQPITVFSTYSTHEYDRKNDDIDPVSASAEYELEKRLERMELYQVDLKKGPNGLGINILGMGAPFVSGKEKLGIYIKSITPGCPAALDGRIQVHDQIVEVDGQSLVGVTQQFAASVIRNTGSTVHFLMAREPSNYTDDCSSGLMVNSSTNGSPVAGVPEHVTSTECCLGEPVENARADDSHELPLSATLTDFACWTGGSSEEDKNSNLLTKNL